MDKQQLIITALQQKIGEMAANYETQIAVLRAEITTLIDEKNEKEQLTKEYEAHLERLVEE